MSVPSARRRVAPALVPLLALPLLLGGCSGDDTPAEPVPSTLAQADTDVAVPRLEFCSLVPDGDVRAALGAEPEQGDAWQPGQPAAGTDDGAVQEVGCSWSAGDVAARAWVFARPVTEAYVARLVEAAGAQRGCETGAASEQAAYGDPSVRQECEQGQRVRYAGLFGDTWLTCELRAGTAAPDLATRAETWCVDVLRSLDPDA